MDKKYTEKEVLSMLSRAVENIEPDNVWEKIKFSKKSGLEDVVFSNPLQKKLTKLFTKKRIASIVAAFVFMLIGILTLNNINNFRLSRMSACSSINMIEYGDKLFFENFKDNSRLYKMDLDGSNLTKLTSHSVSSFIIYEDVLYYTNGYFDDKEDRKIVISELDGSIKKVFEDIDISRISFVLDEWIYYITDEGLYRINEIDSNIEKINNLSVHTFLSHDKKLYFSSYTEDSVGLFSSDLDGQNAKQIFSQNIPVFKVYNNKVFFSNYNYNYNLRKINLGNLNVKNITYNNTNLSTSPLAFDISNNKMYLIYNDSLFEADIDGNNLRKLAKIDATTLRVFNNNIYLYHPSRSGNLYRFNLEKETIEKLM
ncbi:DUF5050 domain-containing protein [Herbivorax sp. ANBcel31]|uniref:DUF5050 domain-containing protein n=1 Tax=Herbivorax sp. ANBcel31 TaxID=3069754 RepID=UPI0027B6EB03|nr:DUF5050 domain-containing protein [Herbivorax sp. ANBcel31]MDQ2086566.1 DUF5050 domain-containing protein [Herbivorax sp. ANBcel31]